MQYQYGEYQVYVWLFVHLYCARRSAVLDLFNHGSLSVHLLSVSRKKWWLDKWCTNERYESLRSNSSVESLLLPYTFVIFFFPPCSTCLRPYSSSHDFRLTLGSARCKSYFSLIFNNMDSKLSRVSRWRFVSFLLDYTWRGSLCFSSW